MSAFPFCGNCRVGQDEDDRDRLPRQQPYVHEDDSVFWNRPLAWCPNEDSEKRSPVGKLSRGKEADCGFVQAEKDGLQPRQLDLDRVHQKSRQEMEDKAAKRIQASFRERRTRINLQASVVSINDSRSSEGDGDARVTAASSSGSRKGRSVSFAGPNHSQPKASGAPPPKASPPPSALSGISKILPQAAPKNCKNGHPLKGPARANRPGQRRCEVCQRCFIQEAMMFSCKRCNYFLCQGCGSEKPVCGSALKPGDRVQLCGMNSHLLNCMNGYVQARADQNRYTVLISELGDTITLPAQNLEGNDAASSSSSSDEDETASEESGSEVFDANNPAPQARRKKRKTMTQLAMQSVSSVRKKSMAVVSEISRVAKSIMGEGLAGGMAEVIATQGGKQAESRVPLLEAWWAEKKRVAKEQLLDVSAPMRKRMLENIGEFVKDSAMRDPDMWNWIRPLIKSAVAGIWDDIEYEIESNIEVALTDQRTEVDLHDNSSVTPGPTFRSRTLNRWGAWYLRLRAFLLNHYLPYNKTFFGKLKDPVYNLLVAMTMLPLFGVRFFFFSVLLFMLTVPGPADEYQLVNYILHFKGTMFFTSGVIMLFIGAMQYNRCYLFYPEDIRHCIETSGPGADEWLCTLVLDYLGSISLVWIAWLVLPVTRRFPSHVETVRGWSRRPEESSVYCCCFEGVVTRGGRLGGLLSYDVFCFMLSFGVMGCIFWDFEWDWNNRDSVSAMWSHMKAVTYWCQVLYALFSLPFALFVVPVFSWLLTHSTFTGFNQFGACVEFAFPVATKAPRKEGSP